MVASNAAKDVANEIRLGNIKASNLRRQKAWSQTSLSWDVPLYSKLH